MQNGKKALMAFLCIFMLFTSSCVQAEQTPPVTPKNQSFTITDVKGRETTFEQIPEKIVVLQASDVEVLYAIGAQEKIVGVGEYCNYPAEALQEPQLASGEKMNAEQIVSLDPDAVIMGTMGQTEDQVKQLTAAGLNVILTNAANVEDTYDSIALMGTLTGMEDSAKAVTENMKQCFEDLRAKAGDKSKTVYFEISPLEYGLWTAGKNTFMQELCDIIGVTNVFEDVDGWAQISEEEVISRAPDYIFTVTMYSGEGEKPGTEIMKRTGWSGIPAVSLGQVFEADNDMLVRPGPRLADAAQFLYSAIYENSANG